MKRLMSEENFTEMCENAQCLAEKNHCASKNQKELHDAIETVVLD